MVVVLLAAPTVAHAAYPGTNGKLAFVRDGQIWTVSPDGTGAAQLTSAVAPSTEPEWSPDGTKILYTRGTFDQRQVRVMNADGTGDAHVFGPGNYGAYSPTWSPDGRQIAFVYPHYVSPGCCFFGSNLYTADADGSDARRRHSTLEPVQILGLEWSPRGDEISYTAEDRSSGVRVLIAWRATRGGGTRTLVPSEELENKYAAAWSPDGVRIAYLRDAYPPQSPEIISADADGSNQAPLTDNLEDEHDVDWSPDGMKVVYSGQEPGCSANCSPELHVMSADGTGRVRLTDTLAAETSPDWQPMIGKAPPGYPRPTAATPMRLALVSAYAACTSPNRTHGEPLAFASCNPPAGVSPHLTVGTPDANGAAANMVGSLRVGVVRGDPATPANEADVSMALNVTDVRCFTGVTDQPCSTANSQGGGDYFGRLTLRVPVRVTDRYNLPAPGGNSPGTGDTTLDFTSYACAQTASTAIGSTCSFVSTVNAFYPGAITEGRRAVVEVDRAEVLDGGASGNEIGMTFLRQGVFIP